MYWDVEVSPEEEEEFIRKIAEKVHKYGMDVAAILMLESVKPLSYVGAQMGRFMLSPFLPVFGENIGMTGEKLFRVFEKRSNVEKLITLLEDMAREEKEKKSRDRKDDASIIVDDAEEPKKKGWRRFIPF